MTLKACREREEYSFWPGGSPCPQQPLNAQLPHGARASLHCSHHHRCTQSNKYRGPLPSTIEKMGAQGHCQPVLAELSAAETPRACSYPRAGGSHTDELERREVSGPHEKANTPPAPHTGNSNQPLTGTGRMTSALPAKSAMWR